MQQADPTERYYAEDCSSGSYSSCCAAPGDVQRCTGKGHRTITSHWRRRCLGGARGRDAGSLSNACRQQA